MVRHLCHLPTRTSPSAWLSPLRMLWAVKWPKVLLEEEKLCPSGPGSLDQAERLEGVGGPGGLSPLPFWGSVEETFLDHGSSDGLGLASGVDLSKASPALFSLWVCFLSYHCSVRLSLDCLDSYF